ncbi:MAG: hypothetical protein V1908_03530 [Candidatus Peregrinibacteria bacterium]
MSQSESLSTGLSADQLQTAMRDADPVTALTRTIDEVPADSVVGRIRIVATLALRQPNTHWTGAAERLIERVRGQQSASRALAQWILERRDLRGGADAVPEAFGEVAGILRALAMLLVAETREQTRSIPRQASGIDRDRFITEIYKKPELDQVNLLTTLIDTAEAGTAAGDLREILAAAVAQQPEINDRLRGSSFYWINEALTHGSAKAIAEYVISGSNYKNAENDGRAYLVLVSTLSDIKDLLKADLTGVVSHPLLAK